MDLETKVASLPGIGPGIAYRLSLLDIYTVEDFIHHYPFRYDDFSKIAATFESKIGDVVTLKGQVWSISSVYTRSRKTLTKALINDSTGPIEAVWFNQPWLTKSIKTGDWLQLSGKIGKSGAKKTIIAPVWEKIVTSSPTTDNLHTGGLIAIYPETQGLSSKWIRTKIHHILPSVLQQLKDPLPDEIRGAMPHLHQALQDVHFPKKSASVATARHRLAFDELFLIQLATLKKRQEWQTKQSAISISIDQDKLQAFINKLPFELTPSQIKVIREVCNDLRNTKPMNRLVQGEVGSGKTVVAAVITYLFFSNNLRTILMAPTEILAFQHFQTFEKLLTPYGIKIGIYTGSKKKLGEQKPPTFVPDIVIGTHALLSDKLDMSGVALVIIDEQQRFGVSQRALLRKNTRSPHFMTMTATPIPRTVALTLYGDLDLSIIDQVPKNRLPIKTHYVPHKKRTDAYQFIAKQIQQGFQIYIITPLIEESETLQSVKAASVEFEKLKTTIFPQFKLGLLHGRLPSKEKEQVINQFKNRKIDILVSTSVVEVGVDVPNATVMVIEGAERFGLTQLHQLRGRVGRGEAQSYALLFASIENPQITTRLKSLEKINDGLKLAELDLKIRGSGELYGTAQSGRWNLKIAELSDLPLLEKTREAAANLLQQSPNLDKYPLISAKLSRLAVESMPD